MAEGKTKGEGETLGAKHLKTPPPFLLFLDMKAMGNTVWSKCLKQAERERI